MKLLDDIAIVGYAETPVGKLPGRTAIELQAAAALAAVRDSGLDRSDIGAVFSFSGYSQAMLMHAARVAEYLGIRPEVTAQIDVGGPGAHHTALSAAAAALATGQCTAALCTYGENGISVRKSGRGRAAGTLTGGEDLEMPYGLNAMITQYALLAQRHVHRYGTTSEQMGAVAVTSRYHASLNPNAHKRELITLEDHQRSTMVASPLRLLDVSLISDGAGAFVVTTKDRAKDLPNAGVGVRGWGMATTHHIVSQAPDVDELGAKPAAQLALSRAGMRADEADVVYIHDACTISTILGVEALGLCREGEGGAYAAEGRLRLGQPHPVNVHGGMLSHGHAGGVFHLIDAVRQLRGEAGERQVSGARRAIVSGNGGVLSTFSTMVLERL